MGEQYTYALPKKEAEKLQLIQKMPNFVSMARP
jgi:hypothetical protein